MGSEVKFRIRATKEVLVKSDGPSSVLRSLLCKPFRSLRLSPSLHSILAPALSLPPRWVALSLASVI